nr:alpha/beta hydrolases superfamily protein [Tanacetum cinerariifolium]
YDEDECDKGIMQTKIELTLKQSQQGVSNDVLVSIKEVEELKRNVWIKGDSLNLPDHRSYALSWKPCQGDSLNLPEHRCGDPNHLIGECPKPPKDKNQRAFVRGSWSDSDEEDDEKVKDETCLIAYASSETSRLMDDDLDEEEAIKVIEKKNLENNIVDETLEIDEIVNIKESRNHPLENIIRKP